MCKCRSSSYTHLEARNLASPRRLSAAPTSYCRSRARCPKEPPCVNKNTLAPARSASMANRRSLDHGCLGFGSVFIQQASLQPAFRGRPGREAPVELPTPAAACRFMICRARPPAALPGRRAPPAERSRPRAPARRHPPARRGRCGRAASGAAAPCCRGHRQLNLIRNEVAQFPFVRRPAGDQI